ncbi:hypothetical protein [Nocardia sp. IFM 10818]
MNASEIRPTETAPLRAWLVVSAVDHEPLRTEPPAPPTAPAGTPAAAAVPREIAAAAPSVPATEITQPTLDLSPADDGPVEDPLAASRERLMPPQAQPRRAGLPPLNTPHQPPPPHRRHWPRLTPRHHRCAVTDRDRLGRIDHRPEDR